MSLWSAYCDSTGDPLLTRSLPAHKWTSYLPIYEKWLAPYVGKTLVVWEIGIEDSGSLQMWHRYFGPTARIIGVEIEQVKADRHRHLLPPFVQIRVGNQSDPAFLDSVLAEFGPPDIVLDDGSHQQPDIRATFDHVYPHVAKNGLYIVEDLHTAYWSDFGGGLDNPGSFINYAKSLADRVNVGQKAMRAFLTSVNALPDIGVPDGPDPDDFSATTLGVHFYADIVIVEKGSVFMRETR